jgi:hypothetical protein
MINENGKLIQQARSEILEAQRQRAIARRRAKNDHKETLTEIELFLDDAAAEGVDLKTPAGVAIVIRALMLKKQGPRLSLKYVSAVEEGWPEGW